jgi:hypothetical protein
MARATVTAMTDGNATEMAAAMVNGNRNGNGQQQQRWQWATATATAMELVTAMEMATAITIVTATARATITKKRLPLHVAAMCSAVAGATPCLHPHGHKGKCIHQRCVMGVTLLRVFAPLQGGGFLTAHHGLFFCFYFTTTVQFTEQPSVHPPIIQALKNPVSPLTLYLLHSSKNPVSILKIYPGSYCTFCQGKPGQGLQ